MNESRTPSGEDHVAPIGVEVPAADTATATTTHGTSATAADTVTDGATVTVTVGATAQPGTVVTYDQGLRGRPAWWRGAVAIAALVAAFLSASIPLSVLAVAFDIGVGEYTTDELLAGTNPLTPALMLANNLALAFMWPAAVLLQWALFGVRPRWMSSVSGRWRWRWFGRLALVIVPVWAVYAGATFLASPLDSIQIDGTVLAMLAVIVLTTPLQAAGEEFGTRGLIQRSAGSWIRSPYPSFALSTFISGAVFTVAHFAADPWLIAYYFVFAASMSVTARGTGGLEAPVLMHAVNNVFLLVPVALMGQTNMIFERDAGVGSAWMLVPMAFCVAAALFSIWWGRRSGITSTQTV